MAFALFYLFICVVLSCMIVGIGFTVWYVGATISDWIKNAYHHVVVRREAKRLPDHVPSDWPDAG